MHAHVPLVTMDLRLVSQTLNVGWPWVKFVKDTIGRGGGGGGGATVG